MRKIIQQFRRGLWWFSVAVAVVIVGATVTVATFATWLPKNPHANYAIILGTGIYSPVLQNRTLEGLRLVYNGNVKTLVVSGGKAADRPVSEASYMAGYIKERAGNSVPVIVEDASRNTFENIANSKAKTGPGSVVIVSDRFHLARGVLLALRLGYYPVYWSAPPTTAYGVSDLAYYYTREVFALISYVPTLVCGCELRAE